MNLVAFNCPNCKAPLQGDKTRGHMFCEYCGTKIMMDDIEFYKEDAKTERVKTVMDAWRQRKLDKYEAEQKKREQEHKSDTLDTIVGCGALLLMCILTICVLFFIKTII